MRQIYYTLILTLVVFFSFGQQKKEDKNEIIAKKIVGSWKLDYALYSEWDKSKIFHTDTIHFFNDWTFRFRSHNTANTDIRTHTGNWEITNNGKVLVHRNRQAQPAFDVPTPDLTFPIRIISTDRIRIDYMMYFDNEPKPKKNNTPVFFDRIN